MVLTMITSIVCLETLIQTIVNLSLIFLLNFLKVCELFDYGACLPRFNIFYLVVFLCVCTDRIAELLLNLISSLMRLVRESIINYTSWQYHSMILFIFFGGTFWLVDFTIQLISNWLQNVLCLQGFVRAQRVVLTSNWRP